MGQVGVAVVLVGSNGCADFGLICFSVEEAKKRIYACSTTTYEGFQVLMSEEESEKFNGKCFIAYDIILLPKSYVL